MSAGMIDVQYSSWSLVREQSPLVDLQILWVDLLRWMREANEGSGDASHNLGVYVVPADELTLLENKTQELIDEKDGNGGL